MEKHELHEEILLFLYQLRNSEERPDLLKKFKGANESILRDTIEHLRERGLIEVEYPYMGVGTLDWRSGEIDFPNADPNDFRNGKIKTAGIEYVKKNLVKKPDLLEKLNKVIGIIGGVAAIVFGIMTLITETRYQDAKKLNKEFEAENDSLRVVLRIRDINHQKQLESKDKEIVDISLRIDSLRMLMLKRKKNR